MAIQYNVVLEKKGEDISVTRTFNGESDSNVITDKICMIQETCEHFNWNEPSTSQEVGKILFGIVNGNNRLKNAIKEADAHGEPLQLFIQRTGPVPDLPFELLYDSQFLVPLKVHVIRHVSDYGHKKEVHPASRPLRVLFMACSPLDIQPVLDFEKEEEIILDVTKDLPVDMDVEDTGSLQGLYECLETNEYDVIHLTGHANIGDSVPYFCMEDEEGFLQKVTPSQLQEVLNDALERPRLVFLSGCRTGETPTAAASFAHELVLKHSPTVLGWGLPVTDPAAITAAAQLYHELSRGKSIADAVFSARQELYKNELFDWSSLRLFSNGTPLDFPLVEKGQKKELKARDIQYTYLQNSQVKILKKGFIDRRRQLQRSLACLKKDEEKIGLLLHGTGGLGKSCLAGKLCERFKDHALIIVHGVLSDFTFSEAVKDAFIRTGDTEGQKILQENTDMPDKIRVLCSVSFQKGKYLLVLDDFEKNLQGVTQGTPVISEGAVSILGALLQYLPLAVKESQLIITSRYTFPFVWDGKDLIKKRLESIGLTSFRGADEQKKVFELRHIYEYPDPDMRQKLIDAGHGNPRLMEALNSLVMAGEVINEDLLKEVKNKQAEFVQELVLKKILKSQSQDFQKVMQYLSVYRLPVSEGGVKEVLKGINKFESCVASGVQLSLIEKGKDKTAYYWVTPLLREGLFKEIPEDEQKMCHMAAVKHYQEVLTADRYDPRYSFELIDHAVLCNMGEAALEEGSRLLNYLRGALLYEDAVSEGMYILSHVSETGRTDKLSLFLNELGLIFYDVGDYQKAVECFEIALEIGIEIYGETHPAVATMLNNLGGAWYVLGDPKKAIGYYEKALEIDREIYGDKHPGVATMLNNLGSAWDSLGDYKKAIEYYEKALTIDREIYGDKHPGVATMLNNLGSAWDSLGDYKKAIEYYEKALKIDREIYGDKHPAVATRLSNLGLAWYSMGDSKKAIEYYEKALTIDREIYGDKHPAVATDLNNLGGAWKNLGNSKKAIEHYEKALTIVDEIYGESHPNVATALNNLGEAWDSLGDYKKAIGYYEKAFPILKNIFGETHPYVATTLNNLGEAWHTLGDPKKAIEYYEKALKIDREIYGEAHPGVARDYNNLGSAWYSLGDPKKAIDYLQQAYTIFQKVYGDDHPHTRTVKEALDFLRNTS